MYYPSLYINQGMHKFYCKKGIQETVRKVFFNVHNKTFNTIVKFI